MPGRPRWQPRIFVVCHRLGPPFRFSPRHAVLWQAWESAMSSTFSTICAPAAGGCMRPARYRDEQTTHKDSAALNKGSSTVALLSTADYPSPHLSLPAMIFHSAGSARQTWSAGHQCVVVVVDSSTEPHWQACAGPEYLRDVVHLATAWLHPFRVGHRLRTRRHHTADSAGALSTPRHTSESPVRRTRFHFSIAICRELRFRPCEHGIACSRESSAHLTDHRTSQISKCPTH